MLDQINLFLQRQFELGSLINAVVLDKVINLRDCPIYSIFYDLNPSLKLLFEMCFQILNLVFHLPLQISRVKLYGLIDLLKLLGEISSDINIFSFYFFL